MGFLGSKYHIHWYDPFPIPSHAHSLLSLYSLWLTDHSDRACTKPTGGDDLTPKLWDIRALSSAVSPSDSRPPTPASTNRRTFSAGVTFIQASPHQPGKLAVGSYDSTVRIFDARNLMRPVCEADVGGRAWTVMFHPSSVRGRAREVLVGDMHAGCRVVRFGRDVMGGDDDGDTEGNEVDPWRIANRFEKHGSMDYGVDWSYKGVHSVSGARETFVGSCSFYDHVLHLWQG